MPNYTVTGPGPDKPLAPPKGSMMSNAGAFPAASRGSVVDKLDVRDILANFVGRRDKDLSGDQAKKDYSFLVGTLGGQMANKMLNHVLIFNQRDDQQKAPFEKRLSSLYDIGSKDKDVDALLKRSSTLSQGPIAGAYGSAQTSTMSALGKPNAAEPISPASAMVSRK